MGIYNFNISNFHIGLFPILMFFIGFYGVITSKKIISSVISISIMEVSIIVFFLLLGFSELIAPPIAPMGHNYLLTYDMSLIADPFPQALMITAVIIGIAVTAINLSLIISLCREAKTTNWADVRQLYDKGDYE